MRYILLVLTFLLVLVAACTSTVPPEPQEPEENPDTPNEIPPTPPVDVTPPAVDYCPPGDVYQYSSGDGQVDATIIGLTTYRGETYCEAHASTVINSPVGDIMSESDYYFNEDGSDVWVVTTVSGEGIAEQTTEVRVIDGEIVS